MYGIKRENTRRKSRNDGINCSGALCPQTKSKGRVSINRWLHRDAATFQAQAADATTTIRTIATAFTLAPSRECAKECAVAPPAAAAIPQA